MSETCEELEEEVSGGSGVRRNENWFERVRGTQREGSKILRNAFCQHHRLSNTHLHAFNAHPTPHHSRCPVVALNRIKVARAHYAVRLPWHLALFLRASWRGRSVALERRPITQQADTNSGRNGLMQGAASGIHTVAFIVGG